MEKPLRIHTHNSENDGQSYDYQELADEFLPPKKRAKNITATDMDGTLFNNDLGQLVFVEKLSKPHNWQMSPSTFNRLIIPLSYISLLTQGAKGLINGLDTDSCKKVLALRKDIIELYANLYKGKQNGEIDDVSHPIANEFAMKMIKLDGFFMMMDSVLMNWFDGMLLMRTRFYDSFNPKKIKHLTKQVMSRKNGHKKILNLGVHQSNKKQKITKQRLNEIDLGGKVKIDRVVHEIDSTKRIVMDLYNNGDGMKIRAITTNLKQIAETAFEESSYKPLLSQYCGGHLPIIASMLEMDENGNFKQQMNKLPVFGGEKKKFLELLQKKTKRKVMVALGDSPTNDTPMGNLAINNGGVFVVVGHDYESSRRRFDSFYKQMIEENSQSDVGHRIWYVDDRSPDSIDK